MKCPYCSNEHTTTHHVGVCPRVKLIQFYPDGTVKSIEFHAPEPPAYPVWVWNPTPYQPPTWTVTSGSTTSGQINITGVYASLGN